VSLAWSNCEYDITTPEGKAIRAKHIQRAKGKQPYKVWLWQNRVNLPAGWRRSDRLVTPDIPVRLLAEFVQLLHDKHKCRYCDIIELFTQFDSPNKLGHLVKTKLADWPCTLPRCFLSSSPAFRVTRKPTTSAFGSFCGRGGLASPKSALTWESCGSTPRACVW